MFNHEIFAATIARAVEVLRKEDAVEQQKSALRALVSLAATTSATIRCYDGVLSIDDVGIAPDVQHIGTLAGRMAAHGIAEIAIGRQAEPAELLALLRGLAEPAGGATVKDRLFAVKSKRIWVLLAEPEDAGPRARQSVSALFEEPDAPPAAGASKKRLKKEDADALAAWNDMYEVGEMPGAVKSIDLGITIERPEPEPAPPPVARAPAPPPPEPELPIAGDTPLGQALLAIARQPYHGNVLDRLAVFTDLVIAALREGAVGDGIKALAMVADLEPGAPEGTARNSYRITLRRVLSGETLMQLAPYVADPELGPAAAAAFARAGSDGTEVLLNKLANAEGIRERRAFMSALKGMQTGHNQVVHMLGHHQWFVARNAAELAGELRLEAAVGELAQLLEHGDQRVRKVAAIALAKIGTREAHEPLLAVLRKPDSGMRAQLAAMMGSAQSAMFALPLIGLLDSEDDPEALREICLALGRMGTSEAMQALERAQKQGMAISKRSRSLKDAAEQGLKRAKAPKS